MSLFDKKVKDILKEDSDFVVDQHDEQTAGLVERNEALFKESSRIAYNRIKALMNAYKHYTNEFNKDRVNAEDALSGMKGLSEILKEPAYPYLNVKPE